MERLSENYFNFCATFRKKEISSCFDAKAPELLLQKYLREQEKYRNSIKLDFELFFPIT